MKISIRWKTLLVIFIIFVSVIYFFGESIVVFLEPLFTRFLDENDAYYFFFLDSLSYLFTGFVVLVFTLIGNMIFGKKREYIFDSEKIDELELLIRENKFEEACTLITDCLKQGNNTSEMKARLYSLRANIMTFEGDTKSARKHFMNSIRNTSEEEFKYRLKSVVARIDGDFSLGEDLIDKALELKVNDKNLNLKSLFILDRNNNIEIKDFITKYSSWDLYLLRLNYSIHNLDKDSFSALLECYKKEENSLRSRVRVLEIEYYLLFSDAPNIDGEAIRNYITRVEEILNDIKSVGILSNFMYRLSHCYKEIDDVTEAKRVLYQNDKFLKENSSVEQYSTSMLKLLIVDCSESEIIEHYDNFNKLLSSISFEFFVEYLSIFIGLNNQEKINEICDEFKESKYNYVFYLYAYKYISDLRQNFSKGVEKNKAIMEVADLFYKEEYGKSGENLHKVESSFDEKDYRYLTAFCLDVYTMSNTKESLKKIIEISEKSTYWKQNSFLRERIIYSMYTLGNFEEILSYLEDFSEFEDYLKYLLYIYINFGWFEEAYVVSNKLVSLTNNSIYIPPIIQHLYLKGKYNEIVKLYEKTYPSTKMSDNQEINLIYQDCLFKENKVKKSMGILGEIFSNSTKATDISNVYFTRFITISKYLDKTDIEPKWIEFREEAFNNMVKGGVVHTVSVSSKESQEVNFDEIEEIVKDRSIQVDNQFVTISALDIFHPSALAIQNGKPITSWYTSVENNRLELNVPNLVKVESFSFQNCYIDLFSVIVLHELNLSDKLLLVFDKIYIQCDQYVSVMNEIIELENKYYDESDTLFYEEGKMHMNQQSKASHMKSKRYYASLREFINNRTKVLGYNIVNNWKNPLPKEFKYNILPATNRGVFYITDDNTSMRYLDAYGIEFTSTLELINYLYANDHIDDFEYYTVIEKMVLMGYSNVSYNVQELYKTIVYDKTNEKGIYSHILKILLEKKGKKEVKKMLDEVRELLLKMEEHNSTAHEIINNLLSDLEE
ncbi:hypothetical protein RI065_10525 [Mycoplasmatota bacterium zrk1]